MTGLEKILKAIEEEAQAGADAVIALANQQAEEILVVAETKAARKCTQIDEKSAAEVKDVISRAKSAAALLEKKLLLETKQQIIGEIITKAKNKLENLPEAEYCDIMITLVKKYAHNEQGRILFSEKDKKRLPADFNEKLNAALSDKSAASLTVAEEAARIDGGFLLIYNSIEENCTFEAMFSDARDTLQDKVNSLLFD